jgi:hypothetical protein
LENAFFLILLVKIPSRWRRMEQEGIWSPSDTDIEEEDSRPFDTSSGPYPSNKNGPHEMMKRKTLQV